MIEITTMQPEGIYTAGDVAAYLKVSVASVYQSIDGKKYRCKLGQPLPKPMKLGKLLRWKGSQILGYLDLLTEQNNQEPAEEKQCEAAPAVLRPGRPRNRLAGGAA